MIGYARASLHLPQITPATELGAAAVAAYARRAGQDLARYTDNLGAILTPYQAGKSIAALINDPAHDQVAYLLTASGLAPVG